MVVFYKILEAVFSVAALLLCVLPHEIAHGYSAYLLGDRTAKYMGRLSMNPLKHINPTYAGIILGGMFISKLLSSVPFIGSIASILMWIGFVLLLKPVPINPANFKDPKKGMAITALMGPLTNIVMAFIACVIWRYLFKINFLSEYTQILVMGFFETLIVYNLTLAVFNLIPVPPLDGSRVLFAFLPDRYYFQIMQYERYIMFFFLILVWVGVLDEVVSRGAYNIMTFFFEIVSKLP